MDLTRLIRDLARPEAYPHDVTGVTVVQTHVSAVFLTGRYAYKVKKPVDLGFLDFTDLARRLHYCREEVRLNRRLAPDVYLGVVPIVERGGSLAVEGDGAPVEYAVKMEQLPGRATLLERLQRGDLGPEALEALGARVARFHAAAASGPDIDRYGRWAVVAGNARENLEQSRGGVGRAVSARVFARLGAVLERRLGELRPSIEARARAHVPRDTHGDLHLDHVYLFPDRPPPGDLVVIDCIEFNERFRYADPVSDMAFLVMDLRFHDRPDLSDAFADSYFRTSGDTEGRPLLDFYVAYRAAVRAKVEGMVSDEPEVPEAERRDALQRARAHWLLALSELEEPSRRPALVLVAGLPGTGKSTLARALARAAGFQVVSSDRVRKELAGISELESAAAPFGTGIYTSAWNERTYAECLERASALLSDGERVIVDASFRERARREAFLGAARRFAVRSLLLVCEAPADVAWARLQARSGGTSDADWSVHLAAAEAWEPDRPGADVAAAPVPAWRSPEDALDVAMSHLRKRGLAR